MKLRDLFSDDATIDPQAGAIEVTGLAMDSRAVKPGDLFFALAGSQDRRRALHRCGDRLRRGRGRGRTSAAGRSRAVCRRRQIRAARWRWPRRNFIRGSPRPSPPSPAPAARPRSPPSRARSGSGSGMPSASIGTIGLVSPKRTIYGSLTTPDPIALHRAARRDRARRRHASCASRRPRTGSINTGSTACASRPAASPICRATTWIIIPTSRIISPPSCGCSAISWPPTARP